MKKTAVILRGMTAVLSFDPYYDKMAEDAKEMTLQRRMEL